MYNSLVQEEDEDKDRFIRRDKVERNMAQLQSFETKLMMELEDMANPDLPLYPNPTRDCEWGCPLQSACVAMDAGEDWMQYMDAYSFQATTVAEEQLKWRQFLPTYEQVNLPVGQLQYNAMMHKLQLLEQETPAAFQQESSDNLSPTESFLEELGMRDK